MNRHDGVFSLNQNPTFRYAMYRRNAVFKPAMMNTMASALRLETTARVQ